MGFSVKSIFSGSKKQGGYIAKCDANFRLLVIAFLIGFHPENKATAPPRLHPVIETLFILIFGCVLSLSKAL